MILIKTLKPVYLLVACLMLLISCSKNKPTIISRQFLPMSGSQVVPAKTVSAVGNFDIDYNQSTRTLSYSVLWSSLSGPITGFHIHGSSGRGVNAPVLQGFIGYPTTQSGIYKGSVLIDGVVFKEEDLSAGKYYINIHTMANPGGEIRGQIEFQ